MISESIAHEAEVIHSEPIRVRGTIVKYYLSGDLVCGFVGFFLFFAVLFQFHVICQAFAIDLKEKQNGVFVLK